jgi:hypothetical protein
LQIFSYQQKRNVVNACLCVNPVIERRLTGKFSVVFKSLCPKLSKYRQYSYPNISIQLRNCDGQYKYLFPLHQWLCIFFVNICYNDWLYPGSRYKESQRVYRNKVGLWFFLLCM